MKTFGEIPNLELLQFEFNWLESLVSSWNNSRKDKLEIIASFYKPDCDRIKVEVKMDDVQIFSQKIDLSKDLSFCYRSLSVSLRNEILIYGLQGGISSRQHLLES